MDFVERLRGGMDRATFEANKHIRINTIQGEINTLKGQIATRKAELGAIAWELFRAQRLSQSELVALCEVMADLEKQIAEKDNTIEGIRQEMLPSPEPIPVVVFGHICPKERIVLPDQVSFCPNCGSRAIDIPPPQSLSCPNCHASIAENATFCSHCGSKIEVADAEPTSTLQIQCPQCGAALPPNASFCTSCGGKVEVKGA
jgi:DNA-directed RNA polymerase subunit RPC12/RpoP